MPVHEQANWPAFIATRSVFLKATMVDEIGKRERERVYPRIFRVKSSSRYKEEKRWIVGLGLGQEIRVEIPEALPLDGFMPSYLSEFIHAWFANSIKFSKPFMMNEEDPMFAARGRELVKSLMRTEEYYAAQVLVNATVDLGPDGVALASQSHPLRENVLGGATTVSNYINATLDHDTMQDMITMAQRVPNERGIPIMSGLKQLIVSVENKPRAMEILNSTLRSDTAENAKNVLRDQENPDLVPWHYIFSPTFWMGKGEDHSLIFYRRQGIQTASNESFDNYSITGKGDMFFSVGHENWRHTFFGQS